MAETGDAGRSDERRGPLAAIQHDPVGRVQEDALDDRAWEHRRSVLWLSGVLAVAAVTQRAAILPALCVWTGIGHLAIGSVILVAFFGIVDLWIAISPSVKRWRTNWSREHRLFLDELVDHRDLGEFKDTVDHRVQEWTEREMHLEEAAVTRLEREYSLALAAQGGSDQERAAARQRSSEIEQRLNAARQRRDEKRKTANVEAIRKGTDFSAEVLDRDSNSVEDAMKQALAAAGTADAIAHARRSLFLFQAARDEHRYFRALTRWWRVRLNPYAAGVLATVAVCGSSAVLVGRIWADVHSPCPQEDAEPGTDLAAELRAERKSWALAVRLMLRANSPHASACSMLIARPGVPAIAFPYFKLNEDSPDERLRQPVEALLEDLMERLRPCADRQHKIALEVVGFADSKCFNKQCNGTHKKRNADLANRRGAKVAEWIRSFVPQDRFEVSSSRWDPEEESAMWHEASLSGFARQAANPDREVFNRRVEIRILDSGVCSLPQVGEILSIPDGAPS